MNMNCKIGLDFGGVIVKTSNGDTPINPKLGLFLEQNNAFISIKTLIEKYDGRVWIISKASKATQSATREWLSITCFYKKTGFQPANLYFCDQREEKLPIAQSLGITHFIDDRISVLEHLKGKIPNLYHFGVNETISGFVPVFNWDETINKLCIN